ncbi:hypothetical protein COH20_006442 [Aspergillus flavus]|nr:hypothetical protein COH20_006442 [Aspergillus flavus]RAQ81475.1 hypothetical protein COH21_012394 [Aspergillus flavus]
MASSCTEGLLPPDGNLTSYDQREDGNMMEMVEVVVNRAKNELNETGRNIPADVSQSVDDSLEQVNQAKDDTLAQVNRVRDDTLMQVNRAAQAVQAVQAAQPVQPVQAQAAQPAICACSSFADKTQKRKKDSNMFLHSRRLQPRARWSKLYMPKPSSKRYRVLQMLPRPEFTYIFKVGRWHQFKATDTYELQSYYLKEFMDTHLLRYPTGHLHLCPTLYGGHSTGTERHQTSNHSTAPSHRRAAWRFEVDVTHPDTLPSPAFVIAIGYGDAAFAQFRRTPHSGILTKCFWPEYDKSCPTNFSDVIKSFNSSIYGQLGIYRIDPIRPGRNTAICHKSIYFRFSQVVRDSASISYHYNTTAPQLPYYYYAIFDSNLDFEKGLECGLITLREMPAIGSNSFAITASYYDDALNVLYPNSSSSACAELGHHLYQFDTSLSSTGGYNYTACDANEQEACISQY